MDGKIDISFVYENDNFYLNVKDNGSGLPHHYNKKQSLGITVIEALTEQLNGSFNFENKEGTCFELKFKNLN